MRERERGGLHYFVKFVQYLPRIHSQLHNSSVRKTNKKEQKPLSDRKNNIGSMECKVLGKVPMHTHMSAHTHPLNHKFLHLQSKYNVFVEHCQFRELNLISLYAFICECIMSMNGTAMRCSSNNNKRK